MIPFTYRAKLDKVVGPSVFDLVFDLGFGVTMKARVALRGFEVPNGGSCNARERRHAADAHEAARGFFEGAALNTAGRSNEAWPLVVRTFGLRVDRSAWLADIMLPGVYGTFNVSEGATDFAVAMTRAGMKRQDIYP